jgi:ADP-ribose pyrophosphatase
MTEDTRSIYAGKMVSLGIESLILPDGQPLELEIVRHPGGAATVAANRRGEVCLLRQYRHAAGGWLWEIPAGKIDPGESPAETAARELAEEAGLIAGAWEPLGSCLTTPGFCDEIIHLFLARELDHVPAQPETHEMIEVHWLPYRQALGMVRDGTIRDAKTMLGMMLAGDRFGN